ncbi:radical SAM protein [Butyrivibrio sp. AE3006]|uniref:radical SAM protein n=1 Tax=Butyrivibrio sp. AE3006 TaxID=1280673 RepID=UPI0003F76C6C|nr:radical SAM protein [Butyrivibrio sp. AE3006]
MLSSKFAVIPKDIDLDNPSEELIKGCFAAPIEIDEPSKLVEYQKHKFDDEYPDTIWLLVTVTMRCNYKCEYCFQGKHDNGINMSGDVVQQTIAYIKNEVDRNPNLKKLCITYFGGEPLMNMQAVRQISSFALEYTKEKGLEYGAAIDTNAFFMTREISEEIKTLGINQAQIAVDGFENFYSSTRKVPKTAFQRVIQNIEHSAINVIIRINVTKKNVEEVKELLKYLYNLPIVKEKRAVVSIKRVMVYSNDPCAGDGGCRLTYLEQGRTCKLIEGHFKQYLTGYLKYVGLSQSIADTSNTGHH